MWWGKIKHNFWKNNKRLQRYSRIFNFLLKRVVSFVLALRNERRIIRFGLGDLRLRGEGVWWFWSTTENFLFLFSLLLHLVGALVLLSECVNVFSPVQLDLGTIEYSMKCREGEFQHYFVPCRVETVFFRLLSTEI